MNDIELKLKHLIPNAGSLNRDALLYAAAFAAGRAAGSKVWRRMSAVLTLAVVVLSFAWLFAPRLPQLPSHAVVPLEALVPLSPVSPEPYQPEPTSYIALMQHMGEYSPSAPEGSTAEPRPPLTPRSRID